VQNYYHFTTPPNKTLITPILLPQKREFSFATKKYTDSLFYEKMIVIKKLMYIFEFIHTVSGEILADSENFI
ncbi:MAG: hypothetical protein KIG90_03905, partial [Muribaculaceae bacterium]|nr:hypothetical protein [Muribaculaceae bacterium]